MLGYYASQEEAAAASDAGAYIAKGPGYVRHELPLSPCNTTSANAHTTQAQSIRLYRSGSARRKAKLSFPEHYAHLTRGEGTYFPAYCGASVHNRQAQCACY